MCGIKRIWKVIIQRVECLYAYVIYRFYMYGITPDITLTVLERIRDIRECIGRRFINLECDNKCVIALTFEYIEIGIVICDREPPGQLLFIDLESQIVDISIPDI